MKRFLSLVLLLMIIVLFAGQTLGSSLGVSGQGAEKVFQLTNVQLVKAGGKPVFEIQLSATAIIHSPNMPGWPDEVHLVSAFGRYNYDTGETRESIYAGIISSYQQYSSQRVFQYEGGCGANPWVHGNASCGTVSVENSIGTPPGTAVDFPDTYPMSANYMPGHLVASLISWEETYPPKDLEWNPYAGTETSNDLEIESPGSYQVFPQNASSLVLSINSNIAPTPQIIEMRWERLDDVGGWQGDIKLPDGSKMWMPISGPASASWSNFPLTLPAFSSNKSELYQVCVRGAGKPAWSPWRRFWIGEPTFSAAEMNKLLAVSTKNQQVLHNAVLNKFVEEERSVRLKSGIKKPVGISESKKQAIKEAKITPGKGELKKIVKKEAAPGVVSSAVLLLTGKRTYGLRENVMFTVQGEPAGDPVVECSSDGMKWHPCIPKPTVRKIGSGTQARFMVQASDPGKYRLRLGNVFSEAFEVKAAPGLLTKTPGSGPAGSALPLVAPAAKVKTPTTGPVSSVKTPAAAPTLVPVGSPAIRLNASNLTAPAKVRLNVQADPKFKAHYVLEKKENGVFREIAHSDQPEFQVNDPGDYWVKAQYLNGNFGAPIAFTVKSKMAVQPAPAAQPLKTKTPVKTKKMVQ